MTCHIKFVSITAWFRVGDVDIPKKDIQFTLLPGLVKLFNEDDEFIREEAPMILGKATNRTLYPQHCHLLLIYYY